MQKFLSICLERAGADMMITPREMLRDYMTVLNILMQNENATFEQIIGETSQGKTAPIPTRDIKEEPAPRVTSFTPEDIEF